MDTAKKLKRMLGSSYQYQKIKSEKQVLNLKKNPPKQLSDTVISVMNAGCIKLEAVVYSSPAGLKTVYDMFVKDSPDSPEWICYDTIPTNDNIHEEAMAMALDKYMSEHAMSYTDCCFNHLSGKLIKIDKKPM